MIYFTHDPYYLTDEVPDREREKRRQRIKREIMKKLKSYTVTRTVVETYQVEALTPEEAKLKVQDPHSVKVVKEVVKRSSINQPAV